VFPRQVGWRQPRASVRPAMRSPGLLLPSGSPVASRYLHGLASVSAPIRDAHDETVVGRIEEVSRRRRIGQGVEDEAALARRTLDEPRLPRRAEDDDQEVTRSAERPVVAEAIPVAAHRPIVGDRCVPEREGPLAGPDDRAVPLQLVARRSSAGAFARIDEDRHLAVRRDVGLRRVVGLESVQRDRRTERAERPQGETPRAIQRDSSSAPARRARLRPSGAGD
jgi:hypothetical protein